MNTESFRDFRDGVSHNKYSQECAKASVFDSYSFPILLNRTQKISSITSHLNDTLLKFGRALSTRRNNRFRDKCPETEHH